MDEVTTASQACTLASRIIACPFFNPPTAASLITIYETDLVSKICCAASGPVIASSAANRGLFGSSKAANVSISFAAHP